MEQHSCLKGDPRHKLVFVSKMLMISFYYVVLTTGMRFRFLSVKIVPDPTKQFIRPVQRQEWSTNRRHLYAERSFTFFWITFDVELCGCLSEASVYQCVATNELWICCIRFHENGLKVAPLREKGKTFVLYFLPCCNNSRDYPQNLMRRQNAGCRIGMGYVH
jgi:hypothetical protein